MSKEEYTAFARAEGWPIDEWLDMRFCYLVDGGV